MNRKFYDLIDPALVPAAENRVFPDPGDCAAIARQIAARGGVDACFGGIGINGHIAFNEPPEPGETMTRRGVCRPADPGAHPFAGDAHDQLGDRRRRDGGDSPTGGHGGDAGDSGRRGGCASTATGPGSGAWCAACCTARSPPPARLRCCGPIRRGIDRGRTTWPKFPISVCDRSEACT